MDRVWFLTNTCYGTRLPGDGRGFVGRVWDHRLEDPDDDRVVHNRWGTECDAAMAGLEAAARERMSGPAVFLTRIQAEALMEQFHETARHRGWRMRAGAVMADHFHLVVAVAGDPEPAKVLGDFKSWGTRRLTRDFGAPRSQTWWTSRGSKRRPRGEAGVAAVIRYVAEEQIDPLVVFREDDPVSSTA